MSLSQRIKQLWASLREPGSLRVLYQGLTLAPRLILHVASIAALAGLLGACVPVSRYDAARSASESEAAGRVHAEVELQETQDKLGAVTAELDQTTKKLADLEQAASQAKLDNSLALKERDDATGLVEQLRGELARVGDDLRAYAEQKTDLEHSLAALQARTQDVDYGDAHAVAMVRLTRDLTSALGDRVTSGEVTVDVKAGRLVLRTESGLVFGEGAALRTDANELVAAVARVLAVHPESALEFSLPNGAPDAQASTLTAALLARGVDGSRVSRSATNAAAVLPPAPAPVLPPAPAQVELSFSVG
jgi:hypothetical protein